MQRLKRESEIFDDLIALLSILCERLAHDALKLCGHVFSVMRERRRLGLENRGQTIRHRLASERQLFRDQLIKHTAQTEDVRARIYGKPARLLRRHVADSADHYACARLNKRFRR